MAGYLRITADRLINGRSELALERGAVLVEGTRIVGTGQAAEMTCPPGAELQDLRFPDCTLLPGLIDVHAHLTFGTPGRTYEQVMRDDSDDLIDRQTLLTLRPAHPIDDAVA